MAVNLIIQKRGDRQYVSFRESFWDPVRKKYSSRTVKNFGRLDLLLEQDPDILNKLQEQVQASKTARDDAKQALLQERLRKAKIQHDSSAGRYKDNRLLMLGPCIYRQIWNKLCLPRKLRDLQRQGCSTYDFPGAVFYMTTARSLMPDSKLAQWNERNGFLYGGDRLKLAHLYRSIDLLSQHKEDLVAYLNHRIAKEYKRVVTAALYDVTTYWFESQDADTLRHFGFSKDCKVNQVQVVMGLLIDQDGIPVDYEIYPGNTSEFGTMIPMIKRLKERYGITDVIITADRGLNSATNLLEIKKLGLNYVIAYRLRNAGKTIEKLIQDEHGWTHWNGSSVREISKYRITTESRKVQIVDEKTGEIQTKMLTSKLLINYSDRRARKDKADRNRLLEKAQRYSENPALLKSDLRKGGKSYLKVDAAKLTAELDQERIEKSELFDGYYGIVYSKVDMKPEEVLAVHHSLWQIEESFRISKSILETRPCFHWKERRIRGHFVICYLALVMHRLLERELSAKRVSLTADQIIDALSGAVLQEVIPPDGQPIYCKSRTEGAFEQIAETVGLGRLPGLASAADVKNALRLKEL